MTAPEMTATIRRLKREAPRDRVVRAGLLLFLSGCIVSWFFLDAQLTNPVTGKSVFRLSDGWYEEFLPYVVRSTDLDGNTTVSWDWRVVTAWAKELFEASGRDGMVTGLALSILAVVVAGVGGWFSIYPASRHMLKRGRMLEADGEGSAALRASNLAVFVLTRAVLIVLRAIPEYVWGFLFLLLFGPVMTTAVLALAFHNWGVLGKLGSEQAEDMDSRILRALACTGAADVPVTLFGIWPRVLPRFLVHFFYSWEGCIREATILGILGLHTLGFHIHHAFAQFKYDEAVYFIALNSLLVVAADLLSSGLRRRVRLSGRGD